MPQSSMKRIPKNQIIEVKIRHLVDECPDTSHLGEYSNRAESEFSIDRAHAEDCASVSLAAKQAKETLEHAQQTVGDLHNAVLAQYNGTLANERLDGERDALDEAYNLLGEFADEATECDCGERGDMGRHEYRYFNPSFNYVDKDGQPADGLTPEEVRKYTRQDYERMERLNRGDWGYIGIKAEAVIAIPSESSPNISTHQTIHSGGLWGIESNSGREYLASVAKDELADLREQLHALGFSKRAISKAFEEVQEAE